MLVKVSHEIINSVNIGFVFDDNSVKKVLVQVGDVVEINYIRNGMKKEVTGTVKRIFTENGHAGHIGHVASCGNCTNEGCYLYIDASTTNNADLEKIDVDCMYDLNIIQKADNSDCIKSPVGCTQVTSFRIVGNELQVSTDYGTTWMKVGTVGASDLVVDEADKAMADQIAGMLPNCMNSSDKNVAVENLLKLFKENSQCDCNPSEDEDDPQA